MTRIIRGCIMVVAVVVAWCIFLGEWVGERFGGKA